MLVLCQFGYPAAQRIVHHMHMRPVTSTRILMVVLVALFVLALGVQGALAKTPNDDQYRNKVQARQQYKPPKAKPTPLRTTGTLPFTGVDLAVVSVGGALVLAGGFGLRRLGRKSSDQS